MELTEKAWHIIQPMLSKLPTGKRGRPWRGNREVLSGILWILRTGAPWTEHQYASHTSCAQQNYASDSSHRAYL